MPILVFDAGLELENDCCGSVSFVLVGASILGFDYFFMVSQLVRDYKFKTRF